MEDLLVKLSFAAPDARIEGLREIIERIALEEPEAGQVDDENALLDNIQFLVEDQDADIRCMMIDAWNRINVKKIMKSDRGIVEKRLEDVDETVRGAAMRYILKMAQSNKNYADFAFMMLCERVNDINIDLRIQATEMLGDLPQARLETLWLSLDKQSKQEKDWCAAGAFVIALEDQFMAVRSAAVRSLCRLSLANPLFAADAKTLMIDTFNDEAEDVRLLAVQSLYQVSFLHKLDFDMTHLESALCLLDDGHVEMRRTSRRLLTVFRLPDEEALQRTVRCLYAALQKYPNDLDEACEALQSIGRQHADLVSGSTAQLLKLQKFYPTVEPRTEDLYYNLKMVLILAACSSHPTLARGLPKYAYKHYMYFRLRYPKYVKSFRFTPWAPLFYRANPEPQ